MDCYVPIFTVNFHDYELWSANGAFNLLHTVMIREKWPPLTTDCDFVDPTKIVTTDIYTKSEHITRRREDMNFFFRVGKTIFYEQPQTCNFLFII